MVSKHDDILLYSGGLDSYIGYWYLKKEKGLDPALLYVDLEHKYNRQELKAISATRGYMHPIDYIHSCELYLRDHERDDAFIPQRNAFLAQIGALYGKNIWIVTQKGETNLEDRSPRFYGMMSELLTYLTPKEFITVDSPFWDMNKTEIVEWYVQAGLNVDQLKKTHSCYSPTIIGINKQLPCGQCGACFRRWVAMSLNDISEEYAVDPWTTKIAQDYLYKGQTGFYGEARDKDIIEALNRKGVVAYVND